MSLLALSPGTEEAAAHGHAPATVPEYVAHHIMDANEWEVFGYTFHLPHWHVQIGNMMIDLSITKHVLMMMIVSVALILISAILFRKQKLVWTGFASVLESLVLFIRDEIAIPNMGEEDGRKFTPFLSTIFLFILILNLLGLIPIFATSTGNLSVTAGFALIVLGIIFYMGMKKNGILGFFKSLIPHGVPVLISVILFPIEIISIVSKIFALTVRLFANMIAGHFALFYIIGIIVMVGLPFVAASVPLALFIDLLEVLVAFIQAYIFTILAALFIGMYMHPEH
ncbi:MAG: F0F1 ATP synthase subunit A [Calditrichia bacterium]